MISNTHSMAIFGPMRLPFLILPPACVMLDTATATWFGSEINLYYLILAFFGALSAHISINALNEYHDFMSGLDFHTQPTPFSGGSGTLPRSPEKAHFALITGLATLAITAIIGIHFLYARGLWLLHLEATGLIIVVTYTKWITRSPLLCLIVPGLGLAH